MAIAREHHSKALAKAATGISGFDQITGGGLPEGRPTLICGGPGCGKTIFAVEFLVRGIERGEPGVFLSFEESIDDLTKNVASLGFDLAKLRADNKLAIDYIHVDPSEIEEAGAYTLDGLFVRLEHAIDSVGAKRVAIDTLEVLFSGLKDMAILRPEIQRLFRWLKERGVTSVITAEAGETSLTRQGLEEYVSDCVVVLGQHVVDQASTRLLRIVKYRGSSHGSNEYPFLIDSSGFSVLPSTSLQLDYEVSNERISTGVAGLDAMLGGQGYFRTSTVLVSGAAGSGKSILAANLIEATCRRGERAMMFAFEESPSQVVRNMRSIGIDLKKWQDAGLLQIRATRPSLYGLEMHLVSMHKSIDTFEPRAVVIDPVSSFMSSGSANDIKAMLIRLFDSLKMRQITGLVTCLTTATTREETDIGISSLIDTWIEVRALESNGERNRGLYLLKSRGMSHSTQVRELLISDAGLTLADVVSGPDGILIGSAKATEANRRAHETREADEAAERSERTLEVKRRVLDAQIAALNAAYTSDEEETRRQIRESRGRVSTLRLEEDQLAAARTQVSNRTDGRKEA